MVKLWRSKNPYVAHYRMLKLNLDKPDKKQKSQEIPETVIVDENVLGSTPILSIKEKFDSPEVPIIGIGGAGGRILGNIVNRVNKYGVSLDTALIETDKINLEKQNVKFKLHIGTTTYGTAKQYRKASETYEKEKDKIESFIDNYLENFPQKTRHDLVFLILGSGGTGVGIAIKLVDYLISKGKRPVPILVLPARYENTRTKFIAAAALYHFTYAPGSRSKGLMTLLVDNDEFFVENEGQPSDKIFGAVNEKIGATIADLLVATELESDGYSSDLNEFLEIFRTVKGIGIIAEFDSDTCQGNLTEIFDASIKESVSYQVNPRNCTRGYIFIQATKDKVTSKSYRDFFNTFSNKDIFHEFKVMDNEGLHFRGVFVGIPIPEKLRNFMRDAEDVRVYLLNEEKKRDEGGRINPKIDKLKDGEEIEVKAPQEIAEELAREATLKRRGELEDDH